MSTPRISSFFFYIFCLDVLFLPYPGFISATFAALILPAWLLYNITNGKTTEYLATAVVGCLLSLVSLVWYVVNEDGSLLQPNIYNTGILCFMFLSLETTRQHFRAHKPQVMPLLKAYIIFVAILAFIYLVSPTSYFVIRAFWTLSDNIIEVSNLSTLTRFTGTLSDPNNLAVIVSSVLAYICFSERDNVLSNILFIALTTVIVVSSMSVTGIACLAFIVLVYVYSIRLYKSFAMNILARAALIMALSGVVYIAYLLLQDNAILEFALQRVKEGSLDSRFSIWAIILDVEKVASSLLIGDGGTIVWNSGPYSPHNGHFHLFFNYGLPVYLLFIYTFFRINSAYDWRDHIFLMVLFIGFTVNVGIYEPRFAGIWVLLLATGLNSTRSSGRKRLSPMGSKRMHRVEISVKSDYASTGKRL